MKHSFLYMPECPVPLWGRDLLCKLNAQITFSAEQLDIRVPLEHTLSLQMALTESPENDTELFPPRSMKAISVGRRHPREGQKCMANTYAIERRCWDT